MLDYYRYQDRYDECQGHSNLTKCPATNTTSWIWNESATYGKNQSLDAPLLDITAYPNITGPLAAITDYSRWDCSSLVVATYNMTMFSDLAQRSLVQATVTGFCQAGIGYAWGFSFLMTFLVCILNVVFVAMMYGIWFGVCGWKGRGWVSDEFKDAVMLVTQAEREYGPEIAGWNADELQEHILRGGRSLGMRYMGGQR